MFTLQHYRYLGCNFGFQLWKFKLIFSIVPMAEYFMLFEVQI